MKLYDSLGPNPRALRMFLIEKGLTVDKHQVDLMGAENRKAPYTDANPGGQLPALQLDDGTVIAETVAIFEYLEEQNPTPALIGTNAKERAETRQWQRRLELRITENVYNGFRFAEGYGLFKDRMTCPQEAAPGLKQIAADNLSWLDGQIAGRDWIVPGRFSICDIILYCCLDFAKGIGQPTNPDLANIVKLLERVGARPSAEASLHPASAQAGMRG